MSNNEIDKHVQIINEQDIEIVELEKPRNGYIKVKDKSGYYNVITKNLKLVSKYFWFKHIDEWYVSECFWRIKHVKSLYNGLFKIKSKLGKWNLLTTNGNILYEKMWFNSIRYFDENFIAVQNDKNLWNLLSYDGKLLFDGEWFENIEYFYNNVARVQNEKGLFNFITMSGTLLINQWVKKAWDFEHGFAKIQGVNNLFNFISLKGRLLSSNMWFLSVSDINGKIIKVENEKHLYNFLHVSGKLISPDKWFISANNFDLGMARVETSIGSYNMLLTSGELLFKDTEYKEIEYLNFKFLKVQKYDGSLDVTTLKGTIITPKNLCLKDIYPISDNLFAIQQDNGLWNIINTNCAIIFKNWVKKINECNKYFVSVISANDTLDLISLKGNIFNSKYTFIDFSFLKNEYIKAITKHHFTKYISPKGEILTKRNYAIARKKRF